MNPLLDARNCTPSVFGLVSAASTAPAGVPPCQILHGHCSAGVVRVTALDGVLTLPAAS